MHRNFSNHKPLVCYPPICSVHSVPSSLPPVEHRGGLSFVFCNIMSIQYGPQRSWLSCKSSCGHFGRSLASSLVCLMIAIYYIIGDNLIRSVFIWFSSLCLFQVHSERWSWIVVLLADEVVRWWWCRRHSSWRCATAAAHTDAFSFPPLHTVPLWQPYLHPPSSLCINM